MPYSPGQVLPKTAISPADTHWFEKAGKNIAITALARATALIDSLPKRPAPPAVAEIVIWPEREDIAWDDMAAPGDVPETLTVRATAGRLLIAALILASMTFMLLMIFGVGADTPVNAAGLVSCL